MRTLMDRRPGLRCASRILPALLAVACGTEEASSRETPNGRSCDAGLVAREPFGCVKVCEGDRHVKSQAEFDALVAEQCDVIAGTLNVMETTLAAVDGLERLKRVDGLLQFGSNFALRNTRGMSGVVEVGGSLNFVFNSVLVDLAGFEALRSIDGFLSISQNQSFASLAPLTSLSHVGSSLSISGNPKLPQCQVDALAARLGVGCGVVPGTFCSGNTGSATCP